MSTRSIIVVTGEHRYNGPETIRIYKHCDGYPTANLPLIEAALKRSLKQTEAEYSGRHHVATEESKINSSQLTGNIIGEATDAYGMGAILDSSEDDPAQYYEAFKPKHLGSQSDLEWIYVIDLKKRTVNIYGGGYTGDIPQVAYKQGTVDPLKYAEHLMEEYRANERQEIKQAIDAINAMGFKVNPPKKTRKSKSQIAKVERSLSLIKGGAR